jgi:hypothetical protein
LPYREDFIEEMLTPPIIEESFHPDPKKALYIQVREEVPITVFGYPLPPIEEE